MGLIDEAKNFLKLVIYDWNLNDAKKYYNKDKFCWDYCIDRNCKYGCSKGTNFLFGCSYQHSINLNDLILGKNDQKDYKKARLICLYLMNDKNYNNTNPQLFNCYATLLRFTGKSKQDYIKSEKYFLKALSMDENCISVHNNYAALLKNKLKNYDKAEYHYKQALKIDPHQPKACYNLACLLIDIKRKYCEGLIYCENCQKLDPSSSATSYLKGKVLYKLARWNEASKEWQNCLELMRKDKKLSQKNEEKIKLLSNKIAKINKGKFEQNLNLNKDVINDRQVKRPVLTQQNDEKNKPKKNKNEENKDEILVLLDSLANVNINTSGNSYSYNTNINKNLNKFEKLSLVDGIDNICCDLLQIGKTSDKWIDMSSLQKDISNVVNKLKSIRARCERSDDVNVNQTDDRVNPMSNTLARWKNVKEKIEANAKCDDYGNTNGQLLSLLADINK